jgi:hypothetical protein
VIPDDIRAKQVEVWAVNPSLDEILPCLTGHGSRNAMRDFNYAFIFRASRQFSKSKGVWDNFSKPSCLLTIKRLFSLY